METSVRLMGCVVVATTRHVTPIRDQSAELKVTRVDFL